MLRWLRPLALLLVLLLAPAAWAGELKVYFLDVGQGDSELIVSPTGKTVLIDAGPPDCGPKLHQRLMELLKAPLDLVILTHPHVDHLGGMEQALTARGAKVFMDSGFVHASPQYSALLEYLKGSDIKVLNATQGRNIDLGGGAVLTLLGPPQPFLSGTRSDPNANSVVARLTYGKRHLLFSGDAEEPTEQMLLREGDLQSDVLKVPHHGSRHSSTPPFLAAVKPSIAIFEVGAHNDYGHPTNEALARYQGLGARIYRTDLDGEIRLSTDGDRISVTTEKHGDPDARLAAGEPRAGHDRRSAAHRTASLEPRPERDTSEMKPVELRGYVSSKRSKVFHKLGCAGGEKIKVENRVSYGSRDEAVAAGLEPAKDCNP